MKFKFLFFDFYGRIGRKSYWLGILAILSIALLAYLPYKLLWDAYGKSLAVGAYVLIVMFLVLLIPGVALATKRLHDRNKSGWWLLPFYFIPSWLDKMNDRLPEGEPLWWMTLALSLGLGLWGFIEVGFLPGTNQSNHYGEPEGIVGN